MAIINPDIIIKPELPDGVGDTLEGFNKNNFDIYDSADKCDVIPGKLVVEDLQIALAYNNYIFIPDRWKYTFCMKSPEYFQAVQSYQYENNATTVLKYSNIGSVTNIPWAVTESTLPYLYQNTSLFACNNLNAPIPDRNNFENLNGKTLKFPIIKATSAPLISIRKLKDKNKIEISAQISSSVTNTYYSKPGSRILMIDIQAPGGSGGSGKTANYNWGAGGGGGGGGAFVTLLIDVDSLSTSCSIGPNNNGLDEIDVKVNNNESILRIEQGSNGKNGNITAGQGDAGAGGTGGRIQTNYPDKDMDLPKLKPGIYLLNAIPGQNGLKGRDSDEKNNSTEPSNMQEQFKYGDTFYMFNGYPHKTPTEIKFRSGYTYKETAGDTERGGGGGGASALANGGDGGSSEYDGGYEGTPGNYGSGGGGGAANFTNNSTEYTTYGSRGGTGFINIYWDQE